MKNHQHTFYCDSMCECGKMQSEVMRQMHLQNQLFAELIVKAYRTKEFLEVHRDSETDKIYEIALELSCENHRECDHTIGLCHRVRLQLAPGKE